MGRDGGQINLGAILLVQQYGPMMVIHADDVFPHNGVHEIEVHLPIGRALHFVLIEPLPAFLVKLHGLKLAQFGQRQGVNASMDEGIQATCKIQRMKFLTVSPTCDTDQHEKKKLHLKCNFHVRKISEDVIGSCTTRGVTQSGQKPNDLSPD